MEGIKEKFLYGRVLGKGSFCVVKSIASHANIVSKHPRYDLSDSMTQHAYESLENELNVLRTLKRHPNIISLRHTNVNSSPKEIILERLQRKTLSDLIRDWRLDRYNHDSLMINDQACTQCFHAWNIRMKYLFDIACAMRYLHANDIILRDLKTENIGFDYSNKLKIFDFGLSVKLSDCTKVDHDQYHFSVLGGTLRYLAPEAVYELPYGKASDVYSFGLLAWEVMALQIPFQKLHCPNDFKKQVCKRRRRPKLRMNWPRNLKLMISNSWVHDPIDRLNFHQICHILQTLLQEDISFFHSITLACSCSPRILN